MSPETFKIYYKGSIEKINYFLSDVFSLGLTILKVDNPK